mgnify:CR=1 FL=1
MTTLLEIRESIRGIYGRYSQYIIMASKFFLSLIALKILNGRIGYFEAISSTLPTVIIAIFCAVLPANGICAVMAAVILAQLYHLSLASFLLGLVVFLLMFLLYFRFSPGDSILIILTPICCNLGIPYVVPLAGGLLLGPASALSVAIGLIVHYLIVFISGNAASLGNITTDNIAESFQFIMNGVFGNRTMLVMIVAAAASLILVYYFRRMRIMYAWSVAIAVGAVSQLIILLIGDVVYDTNLSIGLVFLGMIASTAICVVLNFMFFNLDYSRTEQLQYEDDDYYYYVKAIPKVSVMTRERTVKTINRATGSDGRSGYSERRDDYGYDDRGMQDRQTDDYGNGRDQYDDYEDDDDAGSAEPSQQRDDDQFIDDRGTEDFRQFGEDDLFTGSRKQ